MRNWIALFESFPYVSDRHGEKLIVYHGTGKDFDEFDIDVEPRFYDTDHGKIFFTSSEENAMEYAKGSEWDDEATQRANKPRVIRAYLKIENPLVISVEVNPDNEWDSWGHLYTQEAEEKGHDGIIIETENQSERMFVIFSPDQVEQIR